LGVFFLPARPFVDPGKRGSDCGRCLFAFGAHDDISLACGGR
jgi:hypothetical protein